MADFHVDRDGGNYTFTFNWVGPSGFLSSGQFGTVLVDVLDPDTAGNSTIIASNVSAIYDNNLKAGKIRRDVSDLNGRRVVAFRVKPQAGVSPDYRYEYSVQRTVTDVLQRQDEIEAKLDELNADIGNAPYAETPDGFPLRSN